MSEPIDYSTCRVCGKETPGNSGICDEHYKQLISPDYGGRFVSGQAGRADDLGGTYFRSKMERNYGRYLNLLISKKQIKSWEYEPTTFWFDKIKRGTRSYKPDFLIHNNDGSEYYVEVKGYMDAKDKTKLKRMAKYYPEIKIELVDKARFREIAKWSKIIPGWES